MTGARQYFSYQAVSDRTGLEGRWNFDLEWSLPLLGLSSGGSALFPAALEKQLGLKLEQVAVPTPVLVVDSVDRTPSENPAGAAEAFPVTPVPTEFEVTDVKPSAPGPGTSRFLMPVGGRLDCTRMQLSFLIRRAFDTATAEQVTGIPDWATTLQFDISAIAATAGLPGSRLDSETVAPMMPALLKFAQGTLRNEVAYERTSSAGLQPEGGETEDGEGGPRQPDALQDSILSA